MRRFWLIALWLGLSVGCTEQKGPKDFTDGMTLGGMEVSAQYLNEGRELYMLNCYACHGEQGNGQGPASAYLRPAPRDFRAGMFKFGGVAAGELPHTKDLITLVQRGLTGTAMLPWDVPREQVKKIIFYIKTFSSNAVEESAGRWSEEKPGERILPEGVEDCGEDQQPWECMKDPWADDLDGAIERGKLVYHVNAQCKNCHPTYVSKSELARLTEEAYGMELTEISDDIYRPQLKDSPTYGQKILPPDFLYHPIKNIRPSDSDAEARYYLYRAIAAGIGGTAMPVWKGALSEEDLWSIVHYVDYLYDMRGTDEAYALREELASQPPFEPAAAEEEEEEEEAPEGEGQGDAEAAGAETEEG